MKSLISALFLAGVLGLFAVGCGGEEEGDGHTNDPTPGGTPTPMPDDMQMDSDYAKKQGQGG